MPTSLIRGCTEPVKRVFLVGTGALEGAYDGLNEWAGLDDEGSLLNAALLALLIRSDDAYKSSNNDSFAELARHLGEFRAHLARCHKRTFRLRPLGEPLNSLFYANDTAIINLNWDLTLWQNAHLSHLIQLHGRADAEDTLILPTQYYTDLKRLIAVRGPAAVAAYISPESTAALAAAHTQACELLHHASEVYVWGANLNAYDVEILALLRELLHSEQQQKLYFLNRPGFHKRAAAIVKILNYQQATLLHASPDRHGYYEETLITRG